MKNGLIGLTDSTAARNKNRVVCLLLSIGEATEIVTFIAIDGQSNEVTNKLKFFKIKLTQVCINLWSS